MKKPEIRGNKLIFDDFSVDFQRTLRVPDSGKTYNLPAGLGQFPVKRVQDYADSPHMPDEWRGVGGVFIPMYKHEAMWINFNHGGKPHAVVVAFGKVNAVSGKPWKDYLQKDGYMVAPPQHWIDGLNFGNSVVRQIVAVEKNTGASIESQVTGEDKWGGLQIGVMPAKPGHSFHQKPNRVNTNYMMSESTGPVFAASSSTPKGMSSDRLVQPNLVTNDARRPQTASRLLSKTSEMAIGAGGKIDQRIFPDPYGIEVWDQDQLQRVFIHIASPMMWRLITGEAAPPSPISKETYRQHGYAWFEVYEDHMPDIAAPPELQKVKSVKQKAEDDGTYTGDLSGDITDYPTVGYTVKQPDHHMIEDGEW